MVQRPVRMSAPLIGLDISIEMLPDVAPRHTKLLDAIAQAGISVRARRARYTGPEISCPIAAQALPFAIDTDAFQPENATRHPLVGDVVMVVAAKGQWGAEPPHDLIDVGLFYGADGILQFPFGWVDGSVCGTVHAANRGALRRAGERLSLLENCLLSIGFAP